MLNRWARSRASNALAFRSFAVPDGDRDGKPDLLVGLLAAGQAAASGVISTQVAAMSEGMPCC